ncbi:hypothetical protein [Ralstonia pseudosolanacearum]|uniref:hypothetical protein n=1 Tax=Ralstonia pseudosolanacearum TaxID=1310165 RepID=UPI0018D09E8C|nr:hypothetical protein [Ralstonia pseudosolanacearum]
MASDFELNIFEQDLVEVRALPEASRWELERDGTVPLGLTVQMYSVKDPSELYLARIRWADYFKPPSLKFLHRQTGADNDPTAWPQCRGFRPSSVDACISWTAEGHGLHPEWANSARAAYMAPEAPMQFALLTLQHELDTTYSGRGSR